MKKRAKSFKMLRTGFKRGRLLVTEAKDKSIAFETDGSSRSFHLSKDRPMVVFDPDGGSWDRVEVDHSVYCWDACSICNGRKYLVWSGMRDGGKTADRDYDLHECIECGTVTSPYLEVSSKWDKEW